MLDPNQRHDHLLYNLILALSIDMYTNFHYIFALLYISYCSPVCSYVCRQCACVPIIGIIN